MQAKRTLTTVLAVGCLVGLVWLGASVFTGSRSMAASSPGQRWEYLVVRVSTSDMAKRIGGAAMATLSKSRDMLFGIEMIAVQEALDSAGRQGWELVSIVGVLNADREYTLKRPLP